MKTEQYKTAIVTGQRQKGAKVYTKKTDLLNMQESCLFLRQNPREKGGRGRKGQAGKKKESGESEREKKKNCKVRC